jgi:heat shock protein HslJ
MSNNARYEGTNAELNLASGGKISGRSGCNRLSGKWDATESKIAFTNVESTLKACSSDPKLVIILQDSRSWRIGESELALLDDEGSVLASFMPIGD